MLETSKAATEPHGATSPPFKAASSSTEASSGLAQAISSPPGASSGSPAGPPIRAKPPSAAPPGQVIASHPAPTLPTPPAPPRSMTLPATRACPRQPRGPPERVTHFMIPDSTMPPARQARFILNLVNPRPQAAPTSPSFGIRHFAAVIPLSAHVDTANDPKSPGRL